MEISQNIEVMNSALWLKQKKALVLGDLHLGFEEALHQKGILLPKYQLEEIIQNLKKIFDQVKPEKIILTGDLKHEFGSILKQEGKEILRLFDFLLEHCSELILVKGNHDIIIGPLTHQRKIKVVKAFLWGDITFFHGDEIRETKAKRIIIGHEHPAITLKEKSKVEKYKCFLKGKWKGQEIIVLPSFNPLLEGTDVIKEKLLSPYLQDISNFEVFIIGKEEVFYFGKLKNLK